MGRWARRGRGAEGPRTERVRALVASGTADVVPDRDRPSAATLYLDGTPQSHVDLADPEFLAFEYARHIADVLDLAFPPGAPIDVLHLGGGACTLARYVAVTRPRSRQRVAEVDGELVDFVRRHLPLDPAYRIKVSTRDALDLLERTRPGSQDAIVVDVYAGARMPGTIACRETFALAADRLRPGGQVIVNLADGKPLTFARSMVATARDVFGEVTLLAEPATWRGRRFGNLVLTAGTVPVPADELTRRLAAGPFPARPSTGAELAAFASGAPVLRRTDGVRTPTPPPDLFERPTAP